MTRASSLCRRWAVLWFGGIVCLSLPHPSTALSGGATNLTCQHMTPVHGSARPQTTPPVFSVNVDTVTYSPGDKIRVTLQAHCDRAFTGFLLEARNVDETDADNVTFLGSFNSPEGTQAVETCGTQGQVVTHKGPAPRFAVDFEWTAPSAPSGHVVMTVTFVETFHIFWTRVLSAVIRDLNSSLLVDVTNKMYNTSWTCTDKMELTPIGDCSNDRKCLKLCNTSTCRVLVSWEQELEDFLTFHLSVFVSDGRNKWAAIGFSDDIRMGNDSVNECVSHDEEAKIYSSFNRVNGKSNDRLQLGTDDIVTRNYSLSLHDGILRCSFQRKVFVNDVRVFSLTQPWFLLVAWGNTHSDSDEKQVHVERPVFTANPVTFVRTLAQGTTTTLKNGSSMCRLKGNGLLTVLCCVWASILLLI